MTLDDAAHEVNEEEIDKDGMRGKQSECYNELDQFNGQGQGQDQGLDQSECSNEMDQVKCARMREIES